MNLDPLEERLVEELLQQPRTIGEILAELNEPGDLRKDVSNRLIKLTKRDQISKIDPGTQYLTRKLTPSRTDEVAYRRMMFMLIRSYEWRISQTDKPITKSSLYNLIERAVELFNGRYPDSTLVLQRESEIYVPVGNAEDDCDV